MNKYIYGAGIIDGEIWGPLNLIYDQKTNTFRDSTSKFFVVNVGLCDLDDTTTYASESRDEVSIWVDGAMAMYSFLESKT